MASVLLYIGVFGIQLLFSEVAYNSLKTKKKKIQSFIIILLSSLPIGLLGAIRYDVGTDYWNYRSMYQVFISQSDLVMETIEPGFVLLISLCRLIYDNFQMLFIITSFLFAFIFLSAVYKCSALIGYRRIALILWLALILIYPFSLNGVRQSLAMALIFYGISYLLPYQIGKGEKIKYIICVLAAAFCFHFTAIVFIILLFFRKDFFSTKRILPVLGGLFLVLLLISNLNILNSLFTSVTWLNKFIVYLSADEINSLKILISNSPLLIGGFWYKNLYQCKEKKCVNMILINNISLLFIVLILISPFIGNAYRLFYYCYAPMMLSIPAVCWKFRPSFIIQIGYVFYGLIIFVSNVYVNGMNDIIPYISIFSL